jgi:phospholipase/lecithinase/hemolysin
MVAQGVGNLSNCVVSLYLKGARSVLVPNVDDVSRQPVVIKWLSDEIRTGVQNRLQQFNAALAQALNSLDQAYRDLRIVSPDAFGLFSDFIDHSTNFGLTVSYPAAIQDDGLVDKSFTGPGADYVFWDEYGHPTTKAHAFIATNFMNALTNARPERLSLAATSGSATLNMNKLLIGRNYTVQRSGDLVSWQEAFSFTATAGTNQWQESSNVGAPTFYRLSWKE